MRVALYARVSTKQHGQDPDTQLIPLRDFARAKQHQIINEFVDVGWSGSKERRPGLDGLMRAAKAGKFEAIIVARFDRFARSTTHLLNALSEFQKRKIDFISLNESIDTSTPAGKLVFTVLAAVAELERSIIQERIHAGLERARRQGKQFGRPKNELTSSEVVKLVAEGMTIRAIAKLKGVSRPTVRARLKGGENPGAAR